ncbi:MAG: hypothetical protein DRN96_06420 [Thermoproteota archaeon]|nr:MAG: hypothetical protein DRN96_06420 [Candidatus Korarchaeota archaeon]
MSARRASIIAIMAALGNVLALVSVPLMPGVRVHFSQLPALLLSVVLGPFEGAVTGFLSSLATSYMIGTFAAAFIPLGVAILCFSAGLAARRVMPALACIIGFLAELPYMLFTTHFISGLPFSVVSVIAAKAMLEDMVSGVLIEALLAKPGLKEALQRLSGKVVY